LIIAQSLPFRKEKPANFLNSLLISLPFFIDFYKKHCLSGKIKTTKRSAHHTECFVVKSSYYFFHTLHADGYKFQHKQQCNNGND